MRAISAATRSSALERSDAVSCSTFALHSRFGLGPGAAHGLGQALFGTRAKRRRFLFQLRGPFLFCLDPSRPQCFSDPGFGVRAERCGFLFELRGPVLFRLRPSLAHFFREPRLGLRAE